MNDLNWTDAQHTLVRNLIAEEVEKARLSHKFIPEEKLGADARSIRADEFDSTTATVDDVKTIPLVEIYANVNLTKLQTEDGDLSAALMVIRRAANNLARAHDAIVFRGQERADKPSVGKFPSNVTVAGGDKNLGLSVGDAKRDVHVSPDLSKGETYGEKLVPAVAKALVQLEDEGYIGSYVLILGQNLFEDAHTPSTGSLVIPKNVIESLISGTVHRSSVLNPDEGLLLSLSGEPMDCAVAVAPTFEFLRVGDKEIRQCRVFGRFAFRLKEKGSVVKLIRKGGTKPSVKKATAKKAPAAKAAAPAAA